jgi:uncharacterized protein HemX
MAAQDTGSREQTETAWYGAERLMAEVHRADTAVAALKKIDALIPNPDKSSLMIIKRIIKQALQYET